MALEFLSVPSIPNVPNLPGVPSVFRAVTASLPTPVRMLADAAGLSGMLTGPSWGLFDSASKPVIVADSVLEVEFATDSKIADYPIEEGGFASYNKVALPFQAKIRFAVGAKFGLSNVLGALGSGSFGGALSALTGAGARTTFLEALETAKQSLTLITLVTPEKSYPKCNIIHYDVRRESDRGATLLRASVWLSEVRIAPDPKFSETKAPASADATNTGSVQSTAAPASIGGTR